MAASIRLPLARAFAILVSLLVGAGILGLLLAAATSGRDGVLAAAIAWAISAVTAVAALAFTKLAGRGSSSDPNAVLVSVLGAMAIRMAVPMIAAVIVKLRYPQLLDAGWLAYLIGFYLVALAIETWLALPPTGATTLAPGTPSKAT